MGSQAGWSHAQENSHPVCNIRSWAGLTFVQMTPRYRRATPTPPPRPPSPPSCGARTNPPTHLLFSFALPQIHLTADPTFPNDNIFIISSALLVVANPSPLPLNFHLGKKVFCRRPKYRNTAANWQNKIHLLRQLRINTTKRFSNPILHKQQLFSQFICTPPFDCVSHKWT